MFGPACDHARVVWKYPLKPSRNELDVPAGARVLAARVQGDAGVLWMAVDPAAPTETREFGVFATGEPLPIGPKSYVDTLLFAGGHLVFHVFELGSPVRRLL